MEKIFRSNFKRFYGINIIWSWELLSRKIPQDKTAKGRKLLPMVKLIRQNKKNCAFCGGVLSVEMI